MPYEDELADAIAQKLATDNDFRHQVAQAIVRKKRSWLSNLVIGIARFLFGQVFGDIVERAIDWLFDRFR